MGRNTRSKRTIYLYLLSFPFLFTNAFVQQTTRKISTSTTTSLRTTSKSCSQTLRFNDAKTGTPVHIIGTMHYNPHSITKVEEIIHFYGESSQLGSIVLEQCEERWTLIERIQPLGSKMRNLLDNEFQAAAELASFYDKKEEQKNHIRVVLADENIRDNNERVSVAFKSTIRDIATPGKGWEAIVLDLKRGYNENIDITTKRKRREDERKEYLDTSDLFDINMLVSAPVSFMRYIFGFVAKKPIQGSLLLSWLSALLGYGMMHRPTGDLSLADEAKVVAAGLSLNLLLGIPLLGRVLILALLGDRNEILAKNIRSECERLQAEGRKDEVCVVVLGLAHCNGVKRILSQ